MKKRGIIFYPYEIKPTIYGDKVQFRRPMKFKKNHIDPFLSAVSISYLTKETPREIVAKSCPYGQPGDRLFVKETWSPDHVWFYPHYTTVYRVDGHIQDHEIENGQTFSPEGQEYFDFKWRSPATMGFNTSRIDLKIESVKVEKVREITREDAHAEGMLSLQTAGEAWKAGVLPDNTEGYIWDNATAAENFAMLWDSIYFKKDLSWIINPWVWVVTFKVLRP